MMSPQSTPSGYSITLKATSIWPMTMLTCPFLTRILIQLQTPDAGPHNDKPHTVVEAVASRSITSLWDLKDDDSGRKPAAENYMISRTNPKTAC